jgi:hypothetical protein
MCREQDRSLQERATAQRLFELASMVKTYCVCRPKAIVYNTAIRDMFGTYAAVLVQQANEQKSYLKCDAGSHRSSMAASVSRRTYYIKAI